jgi:hypothetical protein
MRWFGLRAILDWLTFVGGLDAGCVVFSRFPVRPLPEADRENKVAIIRLAAWLALDFFGVLPGMR